MMPACGGSRLALGRRSINTHMGRTSKPTALKELAGNPGKRTLNKTEPKPTGGPREPEHMTTVGQVVWRRTIASMPPGFFTAADTYALASYCEAVAMWTEANIYFSGGGELIGKGSMQQPVVSPWIKIQADSARLMSQLGAKLGLSPVDRTNITMPEGQKDDNPFLYQ